MASEVEDIVKEVDRIMVEMRTNPVTDIVTLSRCYSLRMDYLKQDVKACLKKFMDMVREDKYEDEMHIVCDVEY